MQWQYGQILVKFGFLQLFRESTSKNKIRPDMIAYSSHNILKSLYSFKLQRQKRHKMKFLQAISFSTQMARDPYQNLHLGKEFCCFHQPKTLLIIPFYQKSLKRHYLLHNRHLGNEPTLKFATGDQIFTFLFLYVYDTTTPQNFRVCV